MNKPQLQIQSAEEAEIVFYEAFMHCDVAVMSALWSPENAVCVHPGSTPIIGYEAVTRSWSSILGHAGTTNIRYSLIRQEKTADMAVHIVQEELMDGDMISAIVIATNVYRRFEHSWLMVEHHGSVVQVETTSRTLQ